MMRILTANTIVLAAVLCLAPSSSAPAVMADAQLFGDPPKGDAPKIFGAGFISLEDRIEFGLSLSPDGREIFFTAGESGHGEPVDLLVTRRSADGTWSEPVVANLCGTGRWEFEAFHSPDGRSLLLASQDSERQRPDSPCRIWRAERSGGGWGKPVLLDAPVNSTDLFWPSLSRDGTLLVTDITKGVTVRSELKDGKYQAPRQLLEKGAVHATIPPDGSFVLCNKWAGIYVAFRQADGLWSDLLDVGPQINTKECQQTCPSLSPDGKYIFFSRYNDKNGKSDI